MKYWIMLMLLPLVGAWLFADGAWLFADTDLDETDNAQLKTLRELHNNEHMVRRYSDLAQAIKEKLADDAQDGLSVSDIQQLLSQRNLEDEINKAGLNVGDLLRIRPVKPGVKPPGETDEEDDDDNCIAQLDDEVFADLSEAFVQLKDKLQLVEEIFATLKPTVSEAAVDELMSLESDIKAIAAETEAKIMGAKGETMDAADVETDRIEGEALEAAEVLIDRIEGVALDIAGSIVEKRKRLRCRVKSCTSNCYCRLIGCTTCKAKTIGWWWTKKKDDTEQELQSLFQKQKVTVERAMSKSAKAAFKAHAEFLQRLPVYEFEGYKESFRFFDRSGKGYITADDFRRALTQIQCGRPPTDEQVADLMKEYDLSGDGKVTFEELVVITVKRREDFDVSKRSQMKAMFHQFDKNKNEELEREELAALVQAMGRNLYGTNENTILENFDDNKDGKLQYNEFENFLNNEDRPTSVLSQPQKEKHPEPSTSEPN